MTKENEIYITMMLNVMINELMIKRGMKRVEIYEPPAKKPLTFKGHTNFNGNAQYIPEFLSRFNAHMYSEKVDYSVPENQKLFIRQLNDFFQFKGQRLSLTKRLFCDIKKPHEIKRSNENVYIVIALDRCKITFPKHDVYRMMEANSAYIIGPEVTDFLLHGKQYLLVW